MDRLKSFIRRFLEKPLLSALIVTAALSLVCGLVLSFEDGNFSMSHIAGGFLVGAALNLALAPATMFTLYNIAYLFVGREYRLQARRTETAGLIIGFFYTLFWISFANIDTRDDWDKMIYEGELHSPIWTEAQITVIVIAALAVIGWLCLRYISAEKRPPLVTALSLAALYSGVLLSIVWIIQVSKHFDPLIILLAVNFIIISARVLRDTVLDMAERENENREKLKGLGGFLRKANTMPLSGLLLMLPMLGLTVLILSVFGQEPDSIIRAWTETADWTFSQRVPPAALPYDGHYLCTVAARGHGSLVKPIRTGLRHGHAVTVNRQLMTANAFEEWLGEKLPRCHRGLRAFYDRTGYPLARHINSKWAADAIYIIMKPAEWFFALTLYLFDPEPENRIARQYPHSPLPDMEKGRW